jgi:hypothetical protein
MEDFSWFISDESGNLDQQNRGGRIGTIHRKLRDLDDFFIVGLKCSLLTSPAGLI